LDSEITKKLFKTLLIVFSSQKDTKLMNYNKLESSTLKISPKWEQDLGKEQLEELDVPLYWLQFDPPSCVAHYALGTLYLFILLTALFGNVSVFWLFYK